MLPAERFRKRNWQRNGDWISPMSLRWPSGRSDIDDDCDEILPSKILCYGRQHEASGCSAISEFRITEFRITEFRGFGRRGPDQRTTGTAKPGGRGSSGTSAGCGHHATGKASTASQDRSGVGCLEGGGSN